MLLPDEMDRLYGNPHGDLLVVGVGASAGGIVALKEFFARIPREGNLAYAVVLHLSPEHDSKLSEVLQATTDVPVTQVRGRVRIEPNHVYVIAPNQGLAIADGHIAATEVLQAADRRSPVDLFFRTLADSHGTHAVSVCTLWHRP